MSGEDQERFEDYLELEKYIEQLRSGQVAHPPEGLTPEQARIYQTANLLRSTLPEAVVPDPAFAERLHAELEQEVEDMRATTQPYPALPSRQSSQQVQRPETLSASEHVNAPILPTQPDVPPMPPQEIQKRAKVPTRGRFSRRNLLAGGAVAAASLAVGTGLGKVIDQTKQPSPPLNTASSYPTSSPAEPLVTGEVATTWHFAATLAEIQGNAVRFTSDVVVGYVIRNNDKDTGEQANPDEGKVIAFSAACTHMGCIVQWEKADSKFHCPCHGGLFTEYGKVDANSGTIRYLYPLPRLETKVENGNVYVKVPLKRG